jgi:hypothetical protein
LGPRHEPLSTRLSGHIVPDGTLDAPSGAVHRSVIDSNAHQKNKNPLNQSLM